jgi:Glyoxalase/Bleomycin resistance protein/Dioxygenase superfamily
MSLVQPIGAIFQVTYVEPDMEAAIDRFVRTLGIGPWFIAQRQRSPFLRYRGRPTPELDVTLAWAYSGALQYEIVVQNDDGLSVFREVVEERGYGLHHYGRFANDLDAELAHFADLGFETAFEAQAGEPLGFARVCYIDTRPALGAMLELAEYRDFVGQVYAKVQAASVGWDGKDPIRHVKFGAAPQT